jgi:hypothetical protein
MDQGVLVKRANRAIRGRRLVAVELQPAGLRDREPSAGAADVARAVAGWPDPALHAQRRPIRSRRLHERGRPQAIEAKAERDAVAGRCTDGGHERSPRVARVARRQARVAGTTWRAAATIRRP